MFAARQAAPERCPIGTGSTITRGLSTIKTDLLNSRFGMEVPGN
jgi:hypothetical protein